jgi:hypothetical protein
VSAVYDVLQLVKLDSVFATYRDETTALASFAEGAGPLHHEAR